MPYRDRRGIGRTELIIGAAVVAVLLLIAIPLGLNMSKKSKRAEVRLNVDSIRTVELAHKEAFEEYVSAEVAPRAANTVNADAVPWVPSKGFIKLSWAPEQEKVRGAYGVVTTKDGFTVTGTCDVDGDGKKAVFQANSSTSAALKTDESIY